MLLQVRLIVASVVLLAAPLAQVQAGLITVDPDSVPIGTSLTNAFTNVTISQGDGTTDITAATGLTNTNQFSYLGNPGIFASLQYPPETTLAATLAVPPTAFRILRFDFAAPTDLVSIDLIPNDEQELGSIAAFDISGNLIGSDFFSWDGDVGVRNTLSISGAGIRTLLAGGDADNNLEIDTLRYNMQSVPEPTTLALMGLGLASIGFSRRRNKKAV